MTYIDPNTGEMVNDLDIKFKSPKLKRTRLKCRRADQPLPTRLRELAEKMDELDLEVRAHSGYLLFENGLSDSVRDCAAELEKEG